MPWFWVWTNLIWQGCVQIHPTWPNKTFTFIICFQVVEYYLQRWILHKCVSSSCSSLLVGEGGLFYLDFSFFLPILCAVIYQALWLIGIKPYVSTCLTFPPAHNHWVSNLFVLYWTLSLILICHLSLWACIAITLNNQSCQGAIILLITYTSTPLPMFSWIGWFYLCQ